VVALPQGGGGTVTAGTFSRLAGSSPFRPATGVAAAPGGAGTTGPTGSAFAGVSIGACLREIRVLDGLPRAGGDVTVANCVEPTGYCGAPDLPSDALGELDSP
jgi:hypothetical protein